MPYRTVRINPIFAKSPHLSVLVIYTGGTFGMVYEPQTSQLVPFDFERVLDRSELFFQILRERRFQIRAVIIAVEKVWIIILIWKNERGFQLQIRRNGFWQIERVQTVV